MVKNLPGPRSKSATLLWIPVLNTERQQKQGSSTKCSRVTCTSERSPGVSSPINPSLAEHDMPCLSKQCRSRSVGFWRSRLIWSALFVISIKFICEFLSKTRIKYSDWLEIRSGRGILIYSAWQRLRRLHYAINLPSAESAHFFKTRMKDVFGYVTKYTGENRFATALLFIFFYVHISTSWIDWTWMDYYVSRWQIQPPWHIVRNRVHEKWLSDHVLEG